MGMFEELEAELGIDVSSTFAVLSAELVRADRDMIEILISLRIAKDLTQDDIAKTLGRNKSAVSNFERLGADPHLSTIRRYAAAVGARVRHIVEDASGERIIHDGKWIEVATKPSVVPRSSAFVESGTKRRVRHIDATFMAPHLNGITVVAPPRHIVIEGYIGEDTEHA